MANHSSKTKERKRGGRFLAFFLGLLMGIILIVGSVAGVGVYYYHQPVGKTVETLDTFIPINLYETLFGSDEVDEDGNLVKPGILSSDYATEKIGTLLKDLTDVTNSLLDEEGTLSMLTEKSPLAQKYVQELKEKAKEIGIDLDGIENELLSSSNLKAYLETKMETTALYDVLNGTEKGKELLNDPDLGGILMALCCGEEYVDYVKVDGEIQFLNESAKTTLSAFTKGTLDVNALLGKMALADVIPGGICVDPNNTEKYDNDKILRIIAYGSDSHYTVVDGKAQMNQVAYTFSDGVFYDEGKEVKLTRSDSIGGGVHKLTLEDGTEQYVKEIDGEWKVFRDENTTVPYLYSKAKISDFTDPEALLGKIYLKDVLPSEDPDYQQLLDALMYDKNDNPISIGDFMDQGIDLFTDIELETVLGSTDDPFLNALYEKDGVKTTLGMLMDSEEMEDLIYGVKLKPIIGDMDNAMLNAIIKDDTTLRTLTDPDQVEELINGITLKDILGENGTDNELLKALLTDADGNDTTIGTLMDDEKLNALIDGIELKPILGDAMEGNNLLSSLIKDDTTIGTLRDEEKLTELVNGITLNDVVGEMENMPSVLKALLGNEEDGWTTIGDLQNEEELNNIINGITLKEVVGDMENMPSVLEALLGNEEEGWTTIGDLQDSDALNDIVNGITLKEVVGDMENMPSVLEALLGEEGDWTTIGDLQNEEELNNIINGITLEEIVGDLDEVPEFLQALLGEEGNKTTIGMLRNEEQLEEFINGLVLEDLLGDIDENELPDALKAMFTDADGNKTTIGTLRNEEKLEALINSVYVKDLVEVTPSSHEVLLYLAYGIEGEDYEIRINTSGERVIVLLDGKLPRTLGEVATEDAINDMPLSVVLGINKNDPDASSLLKAIAFDGDRERTIKELMDDMDSIIKSISLADALNVEEPTEGTSWTLIQSIAFDKTNGNAPRTLDDLMNNTDEIIKGVSIADALSLEKGEDPLLDAIAFDANGNPRTLGDLTTDPDAIIKGISIADALDIVNDDSADPLLRSLAFAADGTARTLGDLTEDPDGVIKSITIADALGLSVDDPDLDPILKSIAFESDGTARTLKDLTDRTNEIINGITLKEVLGDMSEEEMPSILKAILGTDEDPTTLGDLQDPDSINDIFNNVKLEELFDGVEGLPDVVRVLFTDADGNPTTIGTLQDSDKVDALIDNIKIIDLVEVTPSSNSALIYFAYGIEGEDYEIRLNSSGERVIVLLEGKSPRTLSEISSEDAINDMPFAAALGINKNDPEVSPLLKALAYYETTKTDENGEIVTDENGTPVIVTVSRTVGELTENIDSIISTVTVKDALNIETPTLDGEWTIMQTLAFEKKVVDGETVIVPRTINQLTNETDEIIKTISLADALGIKKDDQDQHAILMAVLFANDGTARTLGDLMGENGKSIFNGIELATALGVTTPAAGESWSIVQNIAFAKDENGNPVPRTLDDLTGDKMNDIVKTLSLANALGITEENKSEQHAVLLEILYNADGSERTISDLTGENGKSIFNGISLATALGVEKPDSATAKEDWSLLQSIAFTADGSSRTLNDFNDETMQEIIQDITLATALNIEKPAGDDWTIMQTLAFEKKEDGTVTARPLNALTGNIDAIIQDVTLADALGITSPDDDTQHKVLMSIVYDGDRERTLGELTGENGKTLFNSIPLTDVMPVDTENSLVMFLLYGRKGVHYTVENGEVVCARKWIAVGETNGVNALYNEYGEAIQGYKAFDFEKGEYTDAYGNEYFLDTTDLSLGTITVANGVIAQCYYLKNPDGTAAKFSATTLGDLTGSGNAIANLTKRITIQEILGEDAISKNIFLKHLGSATVESLPDKINNLQITDVYVNVIYEKNDDDGSFKRDHSGNLVVGREWWYLLHESHHENCDTLITDKIEGETYLCNCIETSYKVEHLEVLMSNMTNNLKYETIYELSDNGLIGTMDASILDKAISNKISLEFTIPDTNQTVTQTLTLQYSHTENGVTNYVDFELKENEKTIGDLTVDRLFLYVNALITTLDFTHA